MRILLTGAGGQLGRALAPALVDHELAAYDRTGLDIADLSRVRDAVRAQQPELVLNAAAYNAVDQAETELEAAYRANAVGPRNLALAAAEAGASILHVSTDYVFDGEASRPYHEYDHPNPRSVYGRSKLAGEDAVRALNPRHYLVRTAWLYAPAGRNFPSTILARARQGPLRVVDDQRGSPTYAPHLAAVLARLIATRAYGTWHLAGAGEASWYELTLELLRLAGIDCAVLPVTTAEYPRPAPRPRYSALTSIQEPHLRLPRWEDGVREFVRTMPPPAAHAPGD